MTFTTPPQHPLRHTPQDARTRSSIMEGNSFRPEHAEDLPAELQQLAARRAQLLGGAYRLFYRQPVHLVRGQGQYLWDAAGRKYLDAYNNVASLGHCHPAVVAAVHAQMQCLNTHTRYLHEQILDYTEALLATLPAEIDRAMYMCTGSEANDLAVRVARSHSGGTGIIVTREAYHGTSALTSGLSPALGSGQPLAPDTRLVAAPDRYRVADADLGKWFATAIQEQIDDMQAHGIRFAGFMADALFSSDGVLAGPPGFLQEAVAVVRRNGGLFIADEVQPGFGRTGEAFWGFQRHGVLPDLVTLGKPMGNGIPVAALLGRQDILSAFSDKLPYFNTYGGNPVAMAAAQAVLSTIKEEGLQAHSLATGAQLRQELERLGSGDERIGDVRGAGLYIGVELVEERVGCKPATALALDVVEAMRAAGVLTSVCGPAGNVLKIRPPLAFQSGDIDWLIGALAQALRNHR